MKKIYNIEISQNELIVLLELISRINESDILKDFFEDQSEQRILWDFESMLEKIHPVILTSDYFDEIKKARDSIRDEL